MLKLTITNQIKVPYTDETLDDFIYSSLTMLNPKWIENERMKRWNWKTPKKLYFFEEVGENGLLFPGDF